MTTLTAAALAVAASGVVAAPAQAAGTQTISDVCTTDGVVTYVAGSVTIDLGAAPLNAAHTVVVGEGTTFSCAREVTSVTFVGNDDGHVAILEIAGQAFRQASGSSVNALTSVTFPGHLANLEIGPGAFEQHGIANGLAGIAFPAGLLTLDVGDSAFAQTATAGSNTLRSVTLPDSLVGLSIGGYAFSQTATVQNALTSIVLPPGMSMLSVGDHAFEQKARTADANALASVVLGNGPTSLDIGAFAFNQENGLGPNGLVSVTFPPSVRTMTVRESAFAQTGTPNALPSVSFPEGLTELTIGRSAFEQYDSENHGNTLASVSFPATLGTLAIDGDAFAQTSWSGSNALTSVTFPEGLTDLVVGTASFEQEAYSGSTALTSVTFPSGLRRLTVGPEAFRQYPASSATLERLTFGFHTAPDTTTLGMAITEGSSPQWVWFGQDGVSTTTWGSPIDTNASLIGYRTVLMNENENGDGTGGDTSVAYVLPDGQQFDDRVTGSDVTLGTFNGWTTPAPPSPFVPDGYTLRGWCTGTATCDAADRIAVGDPISVTAGGTTLYARWNPTSASRSTLSVDPAGPIPTGEAYDLTVTVRDADGTPVPGAGVRVDVDPAADGADRVEGTTGADGTFATALTSATTQTSRIEAHIVPAGWPADPLEPIGTAVQRTWAEPGTVMDVCSTAGPVTYDDGAVTVDLDHTFFDGLTHATIGAGIPFGCTADLTSLTFTGNDDGRITTLTISDAAFEQEGAGDSTLASVTFPAGLTGLDIGDDAFHQHATGSGSNALASVTFPGGLDTLSIGDTAFAQAADDGSTALTSVSFPARLDTLRIGDEAFGQIGTTTTLEQLAFGFSTAPAGTTVGSAIASGTSPDWVWFGQDGASTTDWGTSIGTAATLIGYRTLAADPNYAGGTTTTSYVYRDGQAFAAPQSGTDVTIGTGTWPTTAPSAAREGYTPAGWCPGTTTCSPTDLLAAGDPLDLAGATTLVAQWNPPAPARSELTRDATGTLTAGDAAQLTVTVRDTHGTPVLGAAVTVTIDPAAGGTSTITGTTGADGTLDTSITSPTAQTSTVTAFVDIDGTPTRISAVEATWTAASGRPATGGGPARGETAGGSLATTGSDALALLPVTALLTVAGLALVLASRRPRTR